MFFWNKSTYHECLLFLGRQYKYGNNFEKTNIYFNLLVFKVSKDKISVYKIAPSYFEKYQQKIYVESVSFIKYF